MQLIKCLRDITRLRQKMVLPKKMLDRLETDLRIIHRWNDEDRECPFEDFHADVFLCGGIAIFETVSDLNMMDALGVSGGVSELVPETARILRFAKEHWLRMDVIFTESFACVFYMTLQVAQRLSSIIRLDFSYAGDAKPIGITTLNQPLHTKNTHKSEQHDTPIARSA